MSTKFFNNTDNTLFDKFCGIAHNMANFDTFRAVVGYFRSSGYFKLRKEFETVSKIQILVGINIDPLFKKQNKYIVNRTFDANEVKQIYTEDFIQEVKDCAYDALTEQGILQLCEDIINGKVEMRIDNSKNLHAKFYLMLPNEYNENKDGWVIMGSSNISNQGLGLSDPPRYELNVAMKDYDDVKYCNDEFEKLWAEAVPLTKEDVIAAKQKTHFADQLPTPYEIYMKVLISTFGMQVEDDFSMELPEGIANLRYQSDAAIQGYQMLLQHNGFFLADVVGLGKTIIATMIAKRFLASNGRYTRMLVVAPPAVIKGWEAEFRRFGIKNTNAQFISSGSLFKVINEEDGYWGRKEFDLIIVDEAHNFRHDHTGAFGHLQKICKAQRINRGRIGGRKKVMLLSATPLNNRPKDFLAQIQLFQDTHNCTIEGIRDLAELFAPWTRDYNDCLKKRKKNEMTNTELTARVDAIYADIRQKVLNKIMVRRTRTNILHVESYREDLVSQGITFPTMLDPISEEYEMDTKLKRLFYDTLDLLTDIKSEDNPKGKGLHYARYRGPEFFTGDAAQKRGAQAQHAAQLLMGIFLVHMVKRLESSFYAFKNSLHTLLNVTEGMIEMFDKGKIVIVSNVQINELQERFDNDIEKIIEYICEHRDLKEEEFTYAPSDFKPCFIEMLKEDVGKLKKLCSEWDEVQTDPKIDRFIRLLKDEIFDRRNLEKKVIVFSESVDTAKYLKKQLEAHLGRKDILCVDADNRNQLWNTIRTNFDANLAEEQKCSEYNILITSDVLAEGVNLHRSNIVVNYDSPWNASRLMQRNGRVNRIGSKAEFVYNYMFYPSKQGDDEIKLYKNALIKLQGFQSALGEDSRIYSHEEIVKEFQLFNKDVTDETDRLLEFMQEARLLYRNNRVLYDRIKSLPAKSRTIRAKDNVHSDGRPSDATIAFLTRPRKMEYYLVQGEAARPIAFLDAADMLRSEPDEKSLRLEDCIELHYGQVRAAMDAFEKSVEKVENTNVVHTRRPADPTNSEALKILKENRIHAIQEGNDELSGQCNVLQEFVIQGTYNQIEDELRRANRKNKGLPISEKRAIMAELIARLYDDYYLDIEENDPATEEAEAIGNIGLVISETII